MTQRFKCPAALLAAVLLAACSKTPAPGSGSGGAASLLAAPSVRHKTTRGDIALRNVSDRIDVLSRQAAQRAPTLPVREQLAAALLTRAQFLGSFDDFGRVLELALAAVREHPNEADAWLLSARAKSAVHRFEEALLDLDVAARLGADVDARRASIHLALGRDLEQARSFARHRVERAPTLEHLGLLANAEAALGEFADADEHYQAALDTLRDVSPFPVAQLSFQRGVMWGEQANQPQRALAFYAEAVRRVPQYLVANVHLAELEASSGGRDAAIERLRGLVESSSLPSHDPEPLGVLAELLLARDPHDATAADLIERGRRGYAGLLAQHRAAFLDHASEFFSGPGGDRPQALALARENLTLRQTPRAYGLAIESAFAAGDATAGCAWMAQAGRLRRQSPELSALLDRESARCGSR